jgi:glycosyltransferase involved in cell wall biosynthesis
VVMPAYNAERYLIPAARSVLAQSMSDLQLMIVDDGSIDGTLDLARSIPDPRVRTITIENGGAARARNAGVRASAPAEFVAFQDADDLWDPEKLEVQLRFMTGHPELVAVGCRMRYISPDGRPLGVTGSVLDRHGLGDVAAGRLFPFPMPSFLLRVSTFTEMHGFDESLRFGSEDLDFCARLAQRGPLQCVPHTLGSVRIHATSAMARDRRRILLAARFVEQRIAASERGSGLSWEEFVRTYRPNWRQRRADWRQLLYRAAAVHHAEGNHLRFALNAAGAVLVSPLSTLRRFRMQKRRGSSADL